MRDLEEIKDNEVHKNLLKTFKNKRILFLENDYTMNHSVGYFWRWCKENKVEYNCLFNVSKLPADYIMEQVEWFDVIAFETQWVYEVSETLHKLISAMKDKKIVLECHTGDPTWFRKPKVVHDVYILKSWTGDMDDWKFHKLRLNKAYWED
jgi:hypothetical protein